MDDLTTLIDRVCGGDRTAYAGVVERFQDMAVGYASSQLGGDRHLAEDVAQEAFLQAYVDLGQLREAASFLEVPVTTVNNRMHCARQHLRQELLDMAEKEGKQAQEGGLATRVQEQIEAMVSLHGSLEAPIQTSLADALRTDVEVRVVAVDHQLGLLAIREFPSPCCTYAFEPVADQRRICFDVHMKQQPASWAVRWASATMPGSRRSVCRSVETSGHESTPWPSR